MKPDETQPEANEASANPTITVSSDGTATPPQNDGDKPEQAAPAPAAPQKTAPESVDTGNPMSEQKNSQTSAAAPVAPVVIKQSSGKGLAAGALVLALLGLGASGFLFVQGQNILKTQQLSFDQKIDKAALGESQNANLLQDNIRKQAEVQAALAQLSDGQKQNT